MSRYGLELCSKGSSMLQPTEQFPPSCAPLFAASIIPGPPPVIIPNPALDKRCAVSTAALYDGSSPFVLADPKMATDGGICARASKPSTNSLIIRKTRHGSVNVKS